MVGNTAPYTVNEWEEDIKLASKHGIDGFALNVGREDWQISQTEKCFDALRRYRSGQGQGQGSEKREFKLFFSFDMSSIPSSCPEDINHLKAYIEKFATSEHYLRYEGRALISTFAGETSLFGCKDVDSAWCLVRSEVEEICPIFFMPCFFIDPGLFPGMTCLDGAFNQYSEMETPD
ncbi:glycoside hydrolase family 71 [Pyrrhoderma noxium]|uniref:Glycoside hydrolase family 71 n=1 Tax=Pyrrhoderma noxium TaxID=2282107 RepID=A0A286UXE8_9AGAM|nr:glycoside hydrolase family 71 [Pyrrhoderma noxium]